MQIDVWSDVVCPWCYVGKRRLEQALARFPNKDDVTVVWHSFELDPNAPKESTESHGELLARKYGMSRAKAEEMQAQMTRTAALDGLQFAFEKSRPENTFAAHRLLHFAARHGLQGAMKERLLRAYFTEGRRIGDNAELTALAAEVGLDATEVAAMLADPAAHANDVRADEASARAMDIRGVPFFVLDQKYGVSGAQPADTLLAAITQAWNERAPAVADGMVCEGDVCVLPGAKS
ncbi:MAG: DsbA family oxidoreductase [Pseudomonadota bacterium]|nr:DsbA family oxidoreductase [Candidatus Moranbacteria bacterium]MDP2314436.1 DsbA family oxidoreductase [Pseudomonadota bacterium]